jgi:glutathione S-transferase
MTEGPTVYTLYYQPGAASLVVHLALLEIGVPHQLHKVELPVDPKRDAEYLRLNPRGQVPTLIIDGQPYFESAALLMTLADRHVEAHLAPASNSPLRPAYYQWIVFLATALGAPFRQHFYPPDLGHEELPPTVGNALRRKIEAGFALLNEHLSAHGPYMLGADFSAVDLLAIMYMRWSRNLPKPATAWPALKAYADRVRTRPSWKKLYEIEGLTEWAA